MPEKSLQSVRIRGSELLRNGRRLISVESSDPAEMYRALGYNYPKFFKMDKLCKWAWLAAEALLCPKEETCLYEGLERSGVAVVLATRDGCLEVDHRYAASMSGIPSPALFVYTLPNIALGEICIRHGFTGEQLCQVQDAFDADALLFWVKDLLSRRGASYCLFGWVEAVDTHHDIAMFWIGAEEVAELSRQQLQSVYNVNV